MNSRSIAQRLVQLGFVASVGILWYVITARGNVSPLLLPTLGSVCHEFLVLAAAGTFWPDLGVTLYELAAAFLIASIAGTGIGYLISRSGYAIKVFDPLLAGIYAIPAILLFPLYVLYLGVGPASKIAMGATIAFFPVVLNTTAGLHYVDRIYVTAARSMGASSRQMFWNVMLPAAFPVVLTGLRIGLISAFLSILGTETIASFSGLGHRIVELGENMDTASMFAYIIFVILISITLNSAVSVAERWGRRGQA
jgi:ABC-type nitrate/sulfonate/bicarbonate transport system permease component